MHGDAVAATGQAVTVHDDRPALHPHPFAALHKRMTPGMQQARGQIVDHGDRAAINVATAIHLA
jgi:hypothetical protein